MTGFKLLELIKNIDKELLVYLNGKHNPFWDTLMIGVTDRYTWIPLYLIISCLLIWKFKQKGIYIILLLALLILASDQISSAIFKPLFQRPRPCHDNSLVGLIRAINGCGGKFGFISSHAANTFAFATYLILLIYRQSKWIFLLLPWSMLVSYSRIYLGVHYPGDILAGAILGISLGCLFYVILTRLTKSIIQFNKPKAY